MKNAIRAFCVGFVFLTAVGTAHAVVPQLLPVQGMLADTAGTPIDGATNMTFALYTVPTSGTAIWTEAYTSTNAVDVQDGFFTVYLGEITALAVDLEAAELWLGIAVGADAEMPRIRVASVPFALEAQECRFLGDLAREDGDALAAFVGTGCADGYYLQKFDTNGDPVCAQDLQASGGMVAGVEITGAPLTRTEASSVVTIGITVGTSADSVAAGNHGHAHSDLTGLTTGNPHTQYMLLNSGASNQTVAGPTTFNGTTDFNNSFNADGAATFNGATTFSGSITAFNSTTNIFSGATTFGAGATYNGSATFNSTVTYGAASTTTFGGAATFNAQPSFAYSSGAPFAVTSATAVTNLNADLLDGFDSTDFIPTRSCNVDYVLKWDGDSWECGEDLQVSGGVIADVVGSGPITTSKATGVVTVGIDIGPDAGMVAAGDHDHAGVYMDLNEGCVADQILKWDGDSWECVADEVGAGAVTGVYATSPITVDQNTGAVTVGINVGALGIDHGSIGGLGDDDHPQYFALGQNETVNGNTTFSGTASFSGTTSFSVQPSFNFAGAPFTVGNTATVANLSADMVDGSHASAFAASTHQHSGADITTGTLDPARYSAYADLTAEGYLDAADDGDLLTRVQSDGRYFNVAGDTVTGAAIFGSTATFNGAADFNAATTLDGATTFGNTGSATFNSRPVFASAGEPFSVNGNTTIVSDLNADLLDNQHATDFALSSHNHDGTYLPNVTCGTIGYVAKWDGSSWECAADNDTNTTYSDAFPVVLTGTTFGLTTTCGSEQILKWNGTAWECAADATGSAGGAVSSVNPSASGGVVVTPTTGDVVVGLRTDCSNGYILKYNTVGSTWGCAPDTGGVTVHSALTGLDADDHPQYFALDQNEAVAGTPVFDAATPFQVTQSTLVTNLNADLLDGQHAAGFATSGHGHSHGSLTDLGEDDHPQYLALAQDETVTGNTTFSGTAAFGSTATFNGTADFNAATTFDGATNTFAGTGTTVFNGTADFNGVTTVDGATTFGATGTTAFNNRPSFAVSGAPFTVTGTTMVSNLNADMLDNLHATDFATDAELAGHNHEGTYLPDVNCDTDGYVISWNQAGGVWECVPDQAGISSVDDDNIVQLEINLGVLRAELTTACNDDQVLKYDVDGTGWYCADDLTTGVDTDTTNDHGLLAGLLDNDHPQYLLKSGATEVVTGIPAFNGGTSGSTAPFTVDSTTVVTNLDADYLDGLDSTSFATSGHGHAHSALSGLGNDDHALYFNATAGDTVTGPAAFNGTADFNAATTFDGSTAFSGNNTFATGTTTFNGTADFNAATTFDGSTAFTGNNTFSTGTTNFDSQPAFRYAGAPFTVVNSTTVTNLSADLLDGQHASAFATTAHNHAGVYLPNITCASAGYVASWNGSAWVCAPDATNDTVEWAEISGIVGTGATQVARGDHLHDAYFNLGENETVTGSTTFSGDTYFWGENYFYSFAEFDSQPLFGFSGAGAPFTVVSAGLVTNLNCDYFDGYDSSDFVTYMDFTAHDHDADYVNVTGDAMTGALTITQGAAATAFQASNSNTTGGSIAVYGFANGGGSEGTHGVYGVSTSTNGNGVRGIAYNSTGGAGVAGTAINYGVRGDASTTSGVGYGVYGSVVSASGYGVYGNATATSGAAHGVYGVSASPSGSGVYGTGAATGVYGTTGSTASGAVGTMGNAAGASGTTYGVYGQAASASGTGVYGTAPTTGVRGYASASSGTNYGVYGATASGSGFAVYAAGPFGTSSTNLVTNLNADMIDNLHASAFLAAPVGCSSGTILQYNGSSWVCVALTTIDHGSLGGLADDDHTQYFALAQNETVTGIPAFNGGTSGSTAPFSVDSTTVVASLNADLLDGYSSNNFALSSHQHAATDITSGTLSTDRYSAYADLTAEGYLDNSAAGDLMTQTQSDGRYFNVSGDTVTGAAIFSNAGSASFNGPVDFNEGVNFYDGSWLTMGSATGISIAGGAELDVETSGAAVFYSGSTVYHNVGSTTYFDGNTYFNSSIPAFNGGTSASTAPFTVDSYYKVTNLNCDYLDGADSSAFSMSSHNHDAAYVNVTGDTMTGTLVLTPASGYAVNASSSASSVTGYFVNAYSGGSAIYAQTSTGSGASVWAYNDSATAGSAAVYGYSDEAISGATYGVRGGSWSSTGYGVHGAAYNSGGTNYGVYGVTSSATGYGVYGTGPSSTTGTGVYGQGNTGVSAQGNTYGVYSVATSGTALYGTATGGGAGTYGVSNTGTGAVGSSTSGTGGSFSTTSGSYGLYVSNNSGTYGAYVTGGTTYGVYISTAATYGLRSYDTAEGGYGVFGRSTSTTGYGVYGQASGATGENYGVYGTTSSASGWAGYFDGRTHTGDLEVNGTITYPVEKTGYVSIAASGFTPYTSADGYGGGILYRYGIGGTSLEAAAPLAQGLRVTGLTCTVSDTSADYDVTAYLTMVNTAGGYLNYCTTNTTSGSPGLTDITSTCSVTIGGSFYSVRFYASNAACGSACRIYGCRINYAYSTEGR